MILYMKDKADVAQFVDDLLFNLNKNSLWTTIISQDTSEDYFARIVTDVSLDDIENPLARSYYEKHMNILPQNTQAG